MRNEENSNLLSDWRKLTLAEQNALRLDSPVVVKCPDGSFRAARFVTGAKHFAAKVIFEGDTTESLVAVNSLGYDTGRI